MPNHPERKSPRLPQYDDSRPGAYFITACTKSREFLFESNEARMAVLSAWHSLLDIFTNIVLDEFVVMPNHIHGIIWILAEGAYRLHPGTQIVKYETLSNIVGAFKTVAATRVNTLRGAVGMPVWQRSFYDRIVRNDHELECIRKYIRNNPVKWAADRDNSLGIQYQSVAESMDAYWQDVIGHTQ